MPNDSSYEAGWQYGIDGFIAGLLVQVLFFVPDWGVNKLLFVLVGIIILGCMAIVTYKEVNSKNKQFAIGFICSTVLMMFVGPTL